MNRHDRRAAKAQGLDTESAEVRYDGRTLQLTVWINTDENLEEVVERVKKAAQGPGLRMCAVAGGEVTTENATELWKTLTPVLGKKVKFDEPS